MIIKVKEQNTQVFNKKYHVVAVTFGRFRSRMIEIGHVIGAMDIAFNQLSIEIDGKRIAQGSLINVEGKIAVQIDKVLL